MDFRFSERSCSNWKSRPHSHRQTQRVIGQKVVVNAAAFGKLKLIADPAEFIVVDADLVHLGVWPVKQNLDDDIVGAGADIAVWLLTDGAQKIAA